MIGERGIPGFPRNQERGCMIYEMASRPSSDVTDRSRHAFALEGRITVHCLPMAGGQQLPKFPFSGLPTTHQLGFVNTAALLAIYRRRLH